MIEEIRNNVDMHIRPNSVGDEYLEAVIKKKDLDYINSILKKYLGSETKISFAKSYTPEIQKTLDTIGGLRADQSFFFKKDDGKIIFAALWPWETNPDKITLKIGIRPLMFPDLGK